MKSPRDKVPPCPKCKSKKTIPISYGMPSRDMLKEDKAGRLLLGGCVMNFDNPKWHCKKCGHAWKPKREGRSRSRA